MMGKLGYDIDVSKMTETEVQFSQQAIKNYKRLNDVIWHGDLYRIISPYDENRAVLMYVNDAKAKAVLFSYNLSVRYKEIFTKVRLQGLDAQKQYKIEETNLMPGAKSTLPDNGKTYSGDYLMKIGLNLMPRATPLSSSVLEITAQ